MFIFILSLSPAVSKRYVIARLFCAGIACLLGMATPSARPGEPAFSRAVAPAYARRALTFAERVGYQYAIEEIYWRHRIWPKENPAPKPSLDAIISQRQLEQKVEAYVRKSQLVTAERGLAITASELQAEMDRMASHTKQPDVLRELFAALENDPFVIAECLAKPILAERLAIAPSVAAVSAAPRSSFAVGTAAPTERHISPANLDKDSYKLPQLSVSLDCVDDTWTATTTVSAPDGRDLHTALWTGSEMIVWGGGNFNNNQVNTLNTGGRYDPATDSWLPTSTTSAPIGRDLHTAVWTGSEMIVWGGYNYPALDLNSGGRYNPSTDGWTATTTVNAPVARRYHTAVWTGSEMVVWGGRDCCTWFNSGGRYNPNTDSWASTSTVNAPEARWQHDAEWTGSEMIVWGGTNQTIYLKTGAKYNPTNNSWTPTSTANAPLGRVGHTAIWSGSEMMVWGGTDSTFHDTNTGGRYDPSADSWSAISINNAPSPRLARGGMDRQRNDCLGRSILLPGDRF